MLRFVLERGQVAVILQFCNNQIATTFIVALVAVILHVTCAQTPPYFPPFDMISFDRVILEKNEKE